MVALLGDVPENVSHAVQRNLDLEQIAYGHVAYLICSG